MSLCSRETRLSCLCLPPLFLTEGVVASWNELLVLGWFFIYCRSGILVEQTQAVAFGPGLPKHVDVDLGPVSIIAQMVGRDRVTWICQLDLDLLKKKVRSGILIKGT